MGAGLICAHRTSSFVGRSRAARQLERRVERRATDHADRPGRRRQDPPGGRWPSGCRGRSATASCSATSTPGRPSGDAWSPPRRHREPRSGQDDVRSSPRCSLERALPAGARQLRARRRRGRLRWPRGSSAHRARVVIATSRERLGVEGEHSRAFRRWRADGTRRRQTSCFPIALGRSRRLRADRRRGCPRRLCAPPRRSAAGDRAGGGATAVAVVPRGPRRPRPQHLGAAWWAPHRRPSPLGRGGPRLVVRAARRRRPGALQARRRSPPHSTRSDVAAVLDVGRSGLDRARPRSSSARSPIVSGSDFALLDVVRRFAADRVTRLRRSRRLHRRQPGGCWCVAEHTACIGSHRRRRAGRRDRPLLADFRRASTPLIASGGCRHGAADRRRAPRIAMNAMTPE